MTSSLAYLVLTLVCLVDWRSSEHWRHVDFFSGLYLGMRVLGAIYSTVVSRGAFRSEELMREWWGLSSDPKTIQRVVILMLADLVVFFDYGHWHTLPALERPVLQGMGLTLYAAASAWQAWTDAYLARHFASDHARRGPMDHGPFRYVRHPRYAAAILAKSAFALVFASALGWLLALAWAALLLKKVSVEEDHLRNMFGNEYETYARRTARLLPGVY